MSSPSSINTFGRYVFTLDETATVACKSKKPRCISHSFHEGINSPRRQRFASSLGTTTMRKRYYEPTTRKEAAHLISRHVTFHESNLWLKCAAKGSADEPSDSNFLPFSVMLHQPNHEASEQADRSQTTLELPDSSRQVADSQVPPNEAASAVAYPVAHPNPVAATSGDPHPIFLPSIHSR